MSKALSFALLSTALMVGSLYFIVQNGIANYTARLYCEKSGKVMVVSGGARYCATIEGEVKP